MLGCAHPAFDGPVILFQNIIEILHRSMPAILHQSTRGFEPHDGWRITGVLVGVDDPRRRMVLSTQGPFRASGSSDLRFRYTVGVNDSSWWKVEVPVEHGYVPRPRHLGLTSGSPAEPFVPSVQHLVPNTGNGTAVTNDSVIGIVSLQLLAELSVLFVNGLVPVLPTPERHSTKRPALPCCWRFCALRTTVLCEIGPSSG